MSTPGISLPPSPGWHYFSFELCHLARSENWIIVQWVLLAVIQWILHPLAQPCREREVSRDVDLPGTTTLPDRDACNNWNGPCPLPGLSAPRGHELHRWPTSRRNFWRNPSRFHQNPSSTRSQTIYLFPSTNKASTGTQAAMEGTTCIVEEEFPEELLHTAPSASLQDNTNEADAGAEAVKDGATDTTQENLPILAPPPLNAIPEFNPAPPSLFSPEQLELIFDLRSHMADQLHRDTLISKQD
jgi:hypothetical protein